MRWLVVDISPAALRLGKYPPLATDTEVNRSLLSVIVWVSTVLK